MPDIQPAIDALTKYGDDSHAAGYEDGRLSRNADVAAADLRATRERERAEQIQAAFDDHMLKEHTAVVERLPFGLGIDVTTANSAFPKLFTHGFLEQQAGVKFPYLHNYFRFPATGVHQGAVDWCAKTLAAEQIPVITFKLPSDDWQGAAAGKYDAVVESTAEALEAVVRAAKTHGFTKARVQMAVHHEPNNGDGDKALFDAFSVRYSPLIRRPGLVEFWANYTGWAQLYGPDNPWRLDALVTEGFDGVAFNPYLSLGDTKSTLIDWTETYLVPFAVWAQARGVQVAVWETGLSEVGAKRTDIPGVRTWIPDVAGDAAELGYTAWIYWNNRKNADRPDWRLTDTAPAGKRTQIVTAMKMWAWQVVA